MNLNEYNILEKIIKNRRSIMPESRHKLGDDEIIKLLELADWAPTKGQTEPWRFIVYGGAAVKAFCRQHAALYRIHTSLSDFEDTVFEGITHFGDKTSHMILVYMKRDPKRRVSLVEELSATAASIQNMLLGAESLGINTLWYTGGLVMHQTMKDYLGLGAEDQILGILNLGYSPKKRKAGKRKTAMEKKVIWYENDKISVNKQL